MMKQQPDNFFREKLGDFQLSSPNSAWDRIESNLDKKSNKLLWLKIAAALLLISVAFGTLIVNKRITTNEFITKGGIEKPVTPKKSTDPEKAVPKDSGDTKTKSSIKSPAPKKDKVQKKAPAPNRPVRNEGMNAIRQNSDENLAQLQTENDSSAIKPNVLTETSAIAIVTENNDEKDVQRSVKLVYAREQADKYLDKKTLADATTEQKKQSTLKKLLDKAYDLKHNQDPLGELRQKKDEILALNFKNDKQRSQNR